MDIITKIDFKILDFIQDNIRCDFLDKLLPIITRLADHGMVPILLAVILLIFTKTRKIGLSMGIGFFFGGVIGNLMLKNIVGRMRPYDVRGVEILVNKLSDFSFPSGHTLIAFETAIVLMKMLKGKLKPIAVFATILASIIAFSRLYLYVHYPTDVIAGIILGSLFAFIGTKLCEYIVRRIKNSEIKDKQQPD